MSPGKRDKGVVCAMAKCGGDRGLCSGERASPGQKGPGIRAKVFTTRGRLGRNSAGGGAKRLKRKMGLHRALTRAHTYTHTHTDRWWPAGVREGKRRGLKLVSDGVEGLKREEGKDDSKHGRMTHRAHDPLNPAIALIPSHRTWRTHICIRERVSERERDTLVPFFFSSYHSFF